MFLCDVLYVDCSRTCTDRHNVDIKQRSPVAKLTYCNEMCMIVSTCGITNRLERSFAQSSVSDSRNEPSLQTWCCDSGIYMTKLIAPTVPSTATHIRTRLITYQNMSFILADSQFTTILWHLLWLRIGELYGIWVQFNKQFVVVFLKMSLPYRWQNLILTTAKYTTYYIKNTFLIMLHNSSILYIFD